MKLPCPPELWDEFSDLLDRALDVPPARRAAWLDEAAAADAPVRFWLQAVLSRHSGLDTVLGRPNADLMS